jgi:hypothetical protein
LRRYTSIPQKSDRQKQIDRLSALLKIACLKRDQYQCVMCGKPETPHPQGDRILNFQTPPDLVVKFQPIDIVDTILRLLLRLRVAH